MSVTAIVPRLVPVAVGVKVTLKMQLAPAVRDVTHPDARKSPVVGIPVIVNVAFPVLVIVMDLAVLAIPLA